MATRADDKHPPSGGRFDEAGDATRRTRLASERTFLAWWRTGLTALAVALGAGKLVPAVAKAPVLPWTLVGVGFALLGVLCVAYALWRHRVVDRALARGEFAPPDGWALALLTGGGVVLGLVILVIVAVES